MFVFVKPTRKKQKKELERIGRRAQEYAWCCYHKTYHHHSIFYFNCSRENGLQAECKPISIWRSQTNTKTLRQIINSLSKKEKDLL